MFLYIAKGPHSLTSFSICSYSINKRSFRGPGCMGHGVGSVAAPKSIHWHPPLWPSGGLQWPPGGLPWPPVAYRGLPWLADASRTVDPE